MLQKAHQEEEKPKRQQTSSWQTSDGANLNKAVLIGADLWGADLTGAQDLTAKQLITTINWQEAILDSSLRVEAEKLTFLN